MSDKPNQERPAGGGSYIRQKDGTLVRADTAAQKTDSKAVESSAKAAAADSKPKRK